MMVAPNTIAWVASGVVCLVATPAATMARISAPDDVDASVIDVVERIGLPAGIMILAVFAVYRAARFLAPIHTEWIRTQVKQANMVCEALPRLERSMETIAIQSREITPRLDRIDENTKENASMLKDLVARKRPES